MGMFSGKCDFGDWLNNRDDEYIANSDFYIHCKGRDHKLDIHSRKDAIPYYPYLIGMGGGDKNKCSCHLSSESFVDQEEREHLEWILRDAIKYYKKCKRKKIPFLVEEACKAVLWHNRSPVEEEIIHRVAADGEKATIEGLHDGFHDYYRKQLYEEMVENGYDKNYAFNWCYGWERYFALNKEGISIEDFLEKSEL